MVQTLEDSGKHRDKRLEWKVFFFHSACCLHEWVWWLHVSMHACYVTTQLVGYRRL